MVYSIQVKRLKHEDPLGALIYKGAKRKSRDDSEASASSDREFVFRLGRTFTSQQPGNDLVLQSDPNNDNDEIRRFRLTGSKRVKREAPKANDIPEDERIPPELQSMIDEYIGPQKAASTTPNESEVDNEAEDYVYDVYFSEKPGTLVNARVGYIDLNEAEEKLVFGSSDSEEEDPLNEDEDSNAEDYYKNDYPDEEDEDEEDEDGLRWGASSEEELESQLEELNLQPEEAWSEEEASEEDARYARYGWH